MTTGPDPYIKHIFGKSLRILLLVFLLNPGGMNLTGQPVNIRPKIGLALSGGGSNGIAHLGVLKVMEEAGLRPDYIAGVSMGSIIGGMYAIGYTSDSLLYILQNTDWDLILTRIIPENKVIFPEKEHYNNSIISLPFTVKKVKFPSGLINGQQIENQLSFYSWPAAGITDFSKLPIPFMCLATDIKTGKLVELRSGYLPDAIRASMAVPTVFTPIKIDTAILIDGGVLRNYPAEEVRNMGADIVIGSYTGFQTYNEDQLQSVGGIVKQIAFLKSHEDYQNQKKITDVLIEPNIKGYSSAVFGNVDSIYERGYKAALPYKQYLKKLADSLDQIAPARPPEYILGRQVFSFDKIEVSGNKIYSDNQILGIVGIEPGDRVDKNYITEKIDLLYGKTWFEKIKYRILARNDSLILDIDCIEEPNAILYGGVYYDSYIRSGVVLRTTFRDLLTTRSLIDFDSFIGQFYRFRLSMLQYLDRNQTIGFSANILTDKTHIPMIKLFDETGGNSYYSYSTRFSVSKYLGLSHLLDISLKFENSSFVPDFILHNTLKRITYKYVSASFDYQVNTLDTKYFPNKGTLLQFNAGTVNLLSGIVRSNGNKSVFKRNNPGIFSFERTYSFKGNFGNYFSPGKKLSFSFKGEILFTVDRDSVTSLHNTYYLGGIESLTSRSVPFIGFHSHEIPVKSYAGTGTGIDIELFKDVHMIFAAELFAVKEINDTQHFSLLGGYGIGVGYNSVIGPLKIGMMQGFGKSGSFYKAVKGYISFGYRF